MLGPGNVPVPNTDPECQDAIRRRRERLKDKAGKVPLPFPFGLLDSFAVLFGVTRFVVVVALLGYGYHYLRRHDVKR